MRINRLQATKQRDFKGKIYGFDIETYNKNKGFVCASIYLDEFNYFVFTSKDDLIKFFKTKRFQNSVIVATNLGFDFFGTFHNKPEVMQFNTLFRGSDLVYAKSYIKNNEFIKNTQRKGKIVFLDTFNYAKLSVEKMGKILNFPKIKDYTFEIGQKPKNLEEWKEMIEYNIRDSEISKKYLQFLYNSFQVLGASPKLTIASTSMSLFKNKFLKDKVYFTHKEPELLDQFKAYYGGRTEAFSRGLIKNYNYYDFNSLYPTIMRDNSFPDPNTMRVNQKNTLQYIRNYEGVSHVSISIKDSINTPMLLPFRHDNKLLFPSGKFTGWYSHVELRKALEIGYEINRVFKTYYFKGMCDPFKEYVNTLYDLRLEYKKENNPMEYVTKIFMNSLYGKFGQKFTDRDNWMPFNHSLEELNKLEWFERVGNFIRIKQSMNKPSSFCIPIWALYVTAHSRIKLYDAIVKSNPVYVDTDSLITKKELPTGNKLGDLKLEMKIKQGLIIKPKMYALQDFKNNDYVKIKGVAKHLNYYEFEKFIKNPSVAYDKFMKFKESMRRGFIPNEITEMIKNLSLEDDKRIWKGEFNPKVLEHGKPKNLNISCNKM